MTEREPEQGSEERSGASPDPVNHRPPEEWRPGDPGDPARSAPPPPGEPPHRTPPERPPGPALGEHPTGAPPEPVTGEYSEGPSGASQAGYEHAGYAPGYGEADVPAAGPGTPPPGGQWSAPVQPRPDPAWTGPQPPQPGPPPSQAGPRPAQPGWTQQPGRPQEGGVYGQAPRHGQGPGYGQPAAGYGGDGRFEEKSTPWGKIIGIGCGALLVVMLVSAVVSVLMMLLVDVG